MHTTAYPALVLNADFRPLSQSPLSLVPWQDAVTAVIAGRVAVVAEYDAWARSPSTRIPLPSVIALLRYQKRSQRSPFTRLNVFVRDQFTCQYCGEVLPASALTFDHVVPRALGGRTSWENVVAACVPCNTRKGSSLGMKPLRPARRPTQRELAAARRHVRIEPLHESWRDYLYWDVALED